MTNAEREILGALIELENAAASIPQERGRADLAAVLARIDRLTEDLPAAADSRLKHYLERKSYQKARMHLEARGGEIQAGGCG